MNICWSGVGGMILSIVVFFLTTVACQNQKWTGYYYQHHSSTPVWAMQNHNTQVTAGEELKLQSSISRPSTIGKMRWNDLRSKPQWQTPMYKPKWQDPFSKPQWQVSKAHHLKPFTKRPFKTANALDKQTQNGRGNSKEWQERFRPRNYNKWVPSAPRFNQPQAQAWPEYIPPLSMFKPSMDDPHALYNFRR